MANQAELLTRYDWAYGDFTSFPPAAGGLPEVETTTTILPGDNAVFSGSILPESLKDGGFVSGSWALGPSVQHISLTLDPPWFGDADPNIQALENNPAVGDLGSGSVTVYEQFTDYITNVSNSDLTVLVTVSLHGSVGGGTDEDYSVGGDDLADRFESHAVSRLFDFASVGGQGSFTFSFTILAGHTFQYQQSANFTGAASWKWPLGAATPSGNDVEVDAANTGHINLDELDASGNPVVGNPDLTFASGIDFSTPECFVTGTRITIPCTGADDAVPVEALAVGQQVTLASGGIGEVVWINRQTIDCRRHARPRDVWPVRVRAHAFGDRLPCRDLWLSPNHAVFAGGVLIKIRDLIDGLSIIQEPRDTVTYYHVRLAQHDVILAEGLPCESYLASRERTVFSAADIATIWEINGCAPLVVTGPAFNAVRGALLERATKIGGCLAA